MRSLAYTLCIFFTALTGYSQEKIYSVEQLREDLATLKKGIEEFNPGLGHFHSREQFDKVYDSLYNAIDREMTDLDFFAYLRRLGAETKEGHTMIGSNSDTVTNIYKGFFNGEFKYLPMSIVQDGKNYIATGNYSTNSELKEGDIITSLNGKSISSLIDELSAYSIVDGDINSVRQSKAVSNFAANYFWFVEKPNEFQIEYMRDGVASKTSLPATSLDSMRYYSQEKYGKRESADPSIDDVYTFEHKTSYAVLTLKTFNRQQKEKYEINTKQLYKEIFSQLQDADTKHLIIDMRNNGGGRTEYVEDMLPYIFKEQRNGILKEAVSWKGKKLTTKYPKVSKLAFDGQIYVLVNHNSFSGGSQLPMMAKEFGDAIVIGSETASRYEGFVAGSRSLVTLPNIGLKCWIPRYITTYPDELTGQKEKNRGVLPDYPITYTYQDRKDKKDLEMEKALSLISELIH